MRAGRQATQVEPIRPAHVMLMAQILGLKSLREIEQAQKSKQKRLYHLGVKSPVSRSALSRMNLVDAP